MKRTHTWALLAVIVGAGAYASTLLATPSSGFTGATLAVARFDEIDVESPTNQANPWQAKLKTKGLSEVYVQNNTWTPGGSTGWHTHPGHSLILVTEGTVTGYDGHDPACKPHVYSVGMGFVDPGGGHVHLLRNEGSGVARTIAVQTIPAGAVRRIDAPAPGNCAF